MIPLCPSRRASSETIDPPRLWPIRCNGNATAPLVLGNPRLAPAFSSALTTTGATTAVDGLPKIESEAAAQSSTITASPDGEVAGAGPFVRVNDATPVPALVICNRYSATSVQR